MTPQDIGKRYPMPQPSTDQGTRSAFPPTKLALVAHTTPVSAGLYLSLSFSWYVSHSSNSHFHASFPPGLVKIPLTGTGVSAINESIGPGGPSGPSADANSDPANKRAGGTSHIGSAI